MIDWKKLILTVVVAALTVSVGVGTAAGQSAPDCSKVSYDGNGTEQNPYEVGNVDQLQCINIPGNIDSSFELVSDISASETALWNAGRGFNPIGFSGTKAFGGTFDGNGHTISNLTITRSGGFVGLFGEITGVASITDARLVDVNIAGGDYGVGAFVGTSYGGAVTRTYAEGSVSGGEYVGGVVGRVLQAGTVTQSGSKVDVVGGGPTAGTGGIVGDLDGTVSSSYATGSVRTGNKGGIIGDGQEGSIIRSFSAVDVANPTASSSGAYFGIFVPQLTSVYSDRSATGVPGVGFGNVSDSPPADEVTGEEAANNMGGLDFNFVWATRTKPDRYPVLQWQLEPAVSFVYSPRAPESGTMVTFNASAVSPSEVSESRITTYEWDFDDDDGEVDETTNSPRVNHSYSSSGQYEVVLTVTDENGKSSSMTQVLQVGQGEAFTQSLPGFSSPPRNIPPSEGGLDDNLVEDLDGDGEVTDIEPTVEAFGKLIRGESLGITSTQASRLDWDGDGGDSVDIDDMVALFGEQIRAG